MPYLRGLKRAGRAPRGWLGALVLLSLAITAFGQREETAASKNPYWPMAKRTAEQSMKLPGDQLLKAAASNAFWLA